MKPLCAGDGAAIAELLTAIPAELLSMIAVARQAHSYTEERLGGCEGCGWCEASDELRAELEKLL